MTWIKLLAKYSPLIAIGLIVILLFHLMHEAGLAGKGSDAAGAGMAKGLTMLYGLLVLGAYAVIILVGLYFYFGSEVGFDERPIFALILLWPLALYLILGSIQGLVKYDQYSSRISEVANFKKWKSVAKTLSYQDPKGIFKFEYASHAKSYGNPPRIVEIKVKPLSDGVYLESLESYADDGDLKYFIGRVRILPMKASNEPAKIQSQLEMHLEKMMPERLDIEGKPISRVWPDESVEKSLNYLLERGCQIYESYTYDGFVDYEKKRDSEAAKNIETDARLKFIYCSSKPDVVLELIIPRSSPIDGPIELNLSRNRIVRWYQTLKL